MGKAERLLILEQDLKRLIPACKEAAQIIMDQNVSKYPILVAHQNEMEIGIPVIEKDEVGGNWNINASTLEEFVAKKIVFNDKVQDFIKGYKDIDEHLCFFVLSELGAQFIYIQHS